MHEIANIPTGTHPGNCISVIGVVSFPSSIFSSFRNILSRKYGETKVELMLLQMLEG